jgi:hypothetical protein
MICFAKPVLTEALYIVQKKEFSIKCAIGTLDERPSIFIRDKQTFSSDRRTMTARFQLKKNSGRGAQGAWRQDELIGGKPPVVK